MNNNSTHQTRRERKFSTVLENLYLKMLSLSSRRLIVSSSCYVEHPTIAAHSATWEMFASSSAGWARWRSLHYSSLVSVAKEMQLNKSCKRSRAFKYMHVWIYTNLDELLRSRQETQRSMLSFGAQRNNILELFQTST